MKKCLFCEAQIPEASARTRFCSDACSSKDRNNRHRKPIVAYEAIPCKNCGKMFTPKQGNSVACGRPGCKAVRVPVLKHKKCLACGNEITTKHRKKYCSDRCASKTWGKKYKDKSCIYCGEMFTPKNSRVQTCQKPVCLRTHYLSQQKARNLAEAGCAQLKERRIAKCPRCERLYEKTFISGWLGRGTPRFFCNCCSMGYVANNSVYNEYAVRI